MAVWPVTGCAESHTQVAFAQPRAGSRLPPTPPTHTFIQVAMVAAVDDSSLLINAATGLFSGAIGAVLVAGQIAWRGEVARHRFQAETAMYRTLVAYRIRMVYEHTSTRGVCNEGLGSVSLDGREQLTRDILAHLPYLSTKTQKYIGTTLADLVGPETVDLISNRLGIPDSQLDPKAEEGRREVVEHRLRLDSAVRDGAYAYATAHGVLGLVCVSPNDRERHQSYVDRALTLIDDTAAAVAPNRGWYRYWRRRRLHR